MTTLKDLVFRVEESLPNEVVEFLSNQIVSYNSSQVGPEKRQRLVAVVNDPDGSIVGGGIGYVGWEWLHISSLWVSESIRGQGVGTALLGRIEEAARSRGCRRVHLDTYDFQALGFYEKLGYEVFGKLENYPRGHTRHFLSRRLT